MTASGVLKNLDIPYSKLFRCLQVGTFEGHFKVSVLSFVN